MRRDSQEVYCEARQAVDSANGNFHVAYLPFIEPLKSLKRAVRLVNILTKENALTRTVTAPDSIWLAGLTFDFLTRLLRFNKVCI